MASSDQFTTQEKEEPTFELGAPPGWQRKIVSAKKGGTPSRKDVYFVTPDGEEIKSKRALDQYLKKHPRGPTASDFNWSTGETPTRRSSRLSSKTRPSPDSSVQSGGKRAKKDMKEVLKEDEDMIEAGEPANDHPPPSNPETDYVPQQKDEENVEEENTPLGPLPEDLSTPLPKRNENVLDMQPMMEETQKLAEVHASTEVANLVAAKEEGKKVDLQVMHMEEKVAEKGAQDDGKHNDVTNIGALLIVEETLKQEEYDKACQQCPEAQNASRPAPVGVST